MKISDIKTLADVMNHADLSVLEYSEGEAHIRLERGTKQVVTVAAPQPVIDPAVAPHSVSEEEQNDFNNLCELKAPMVGVFYAAPSPDAKPFVRVGDTVEKGQVVCIIEAMKLMNDITAPVTGRIVDILALDGAVLEFGQTIMKIV